MIQSKAELKEFLSVEGAIYNRRWYYDLPFLMTEEQARYKVFRYLRVAEYAENTHHPLRKLYLLRSLRIQTRFSINVPMNTLGKGFHLIHLGPIIVSDNARVGEYCQMHAGACVVKNHGVAPVLGDHVFIGLGAKIIGDISIADYVEVGANAVVTKSCSTKGARLMGVPAKEYPPGVRTDEPR